MKINIDLIYPIGAVYISTNTINPSTLFGGEWQQIKDTFLLACGDTYDIGKQGGEATHKLINAELPNLTGTIPHIAGDESSVTGVFSHTSSGSSYKEGTQSGTSVNTKHLFSIGGNQAHNNMPPYLAVCVWERIG